jgi:type II secretory pathway predicted ATPase ExeA
MTDIATLLEDAAGYAGMDEYPGAVLIRQLATALAFEHDRAVQAEREAARSESRYGAMAGERGAMGEQWSEMRKELDVAEARADRAEAQAKQNTADAWELGMQAGFYQGKNVSNPYRTEAIA